MRIKYLIVGLLVSVFAFNAVASTTYTELPGQEISLSQEVEESYVKDLELIKPCTLEYNFDLTFEDGTTMHFEGSVSASNCKKAAKAIADMMKEE